MRTIPATNRSVFVWGTFSRLCAALRARRNLLRARSGVKLWGVGLLGVITVVAVTGTPAFAVTPINLGSAEPYAVIAGSTITNTGSTVITGDVGLSPGTAITGFPPGTASGTTDAADAVALAAQNSATAAFGVAAGETPFTAVPGGTIGGNTYVAGVYQAASAMQLTGTVTLNGAGDPSAVFIFQAGSTLITASNSNVVFENGAQACNVFWEVGSSATLGTTTAFAGTILALTSITLDTGASEVGGLFAQTGAVTLDDNVISTTTCSTPRTPTPAPTTTTTTTTTTTPVTTTTTGVPVAVITTTKPKGGAHPVGKGHKGTTTTTSGSSTTIIPVGAPATGEGSSVSSFSPLGLIALGAMATSAGAGSIALRLRRRR
jgi:Ice-binding-like